MVKIAFNQPLKRRKKGWSLKFKATAWAIAISTLPIFSFGTAIYWLGNRSLEQYLLKATEAGVPSVVENVLLLERELLALMIGTGITVLLVCISTVWFTNRAIRPILGLAQVTSHLVNRLFRANLSVQERLALRDEIALVKANISLIEEQLPNVLWQHEAETERSQTLLKITRSIQEALSEKDIFKTAVEEMRQTLKADRVAIFCFDQDWEGTFVEESVAPAWPKALWATVHDPCFEVDYVKKYLHGRARAIDNIYNAGLSDCHIGLLERFAVKSNLVAPIVKNNQLFGLLIAHQCARPRTWQQVEIDLFGQVAMQIGFTLDRIWRTNQLEQTYQQATTTVRQKMEHQELLQQQLSDFLEQNQVALKHLGTEIPQQMDLIAKAYNQMKEVADASRGIFALERQWGWDTEGINAIIEAIEAETQQLSLTMESVIEQSDDNYQLIARIRAQLERLNLASGTMKSRLDEIAQSTAQLAPTLDSASQLMLEVARIAKENSEQSNILAESVHKLVLINQKLHTHTQKTNPINTQTIQEEYYQSQTSNGYQVNSVHNN